MEDELLKLMLNPTRPGAMLPEWVLRGFGKHRQAVENAERIEVRADVAQLYVEIEAIGIPIDGVISTVALRLSQEYLDQMGIGLSSLFPPLPTTVSSYPILGWREWNASTEGRMIGLFGKRWETPLMHAVCNGKATPSVPHERERCGIYLYKSYPINGVGGEWPALDRYVGLAVAERLIEHERGYRAGVVRCIAITGISDQAHGWDGISIMPYPDLIDLCDSYITNPETIPYPDDSPAP